MDTGNFLPSTNLWQSSKYRAICHCDENHVIQIHVLLMKLWVDHLYIIYAGDLEEIIFFSVIY